jgi:hypothetical protein
VLAAAYPPGFAAKHSKAAQPKGQTRAFTMGDSSYVVKRIDFFGR